MKILKPLTIALLLASYANAQPNPAPKARHKFIVAAHRGDHTIYPENTLEGYAMAIKDGADYIEIDLRTTSDGKLVSMHDATINRMTVGKGLVKDFTLEQLLVLKIKARSSADTATYRIPTFEQILQLCRNKIYIYIDFKEADATATINLLKLSCPEIGLHKNVDQNDKKSKFNSGKRVNSCRIFDWQYELS